MRILVDVFKIFTMMIVSFYFLKCLIPKKEAFGKTDYVKLARLQRKWKISLSRPLTERVRPRSLSEISGQAEGLFAMKAALFGKYPKHVILYGPPGVGKTTAARLIFEAAKKSPDSPFLAGAPFIEADASLIRFDERGIADPLIGSVHDPIYQGAGEKGLGGVPQIKEGAVTRAHGGVLFLDEIGEMHPMEMMRLLKVMEDRVVRFESAYFDRDMPGMDEYTKRAFEKGLPADFRLIAATTKNPGDLPGALRSRAVEIVFSSLTRSEKEKIARMAARRCGIHLTDEMAELVGKYAKSGRSAVNILELSMGAAAVQKRQSVSNNDIRWAIEMSNKKNSNFEDSQRP